MRLLKHPSKGFCKALGASQSTQTKSMYKGDFMEPQGYSLSTQAKPLYRGGFPKHPSKVHIQRGLHEASE